MNTSHFSKRLIEWYEKHGRHDLPWQKNPTPYRVWISEIMLQQTQVATVIPYYQRFMRRFPTLSSLANATLDEVLAHWSGLGYYARARNLHRAAQIIRDEHKGRFPSAVETISALPGIGKSTAGAILSFSKKQFAVILDGNVKRVLTRVFAIDKPINLTQTTHTLWDIANQLTPKNQAHYYNQAIMDLGATLCTRSKPRCPDCPFFTSCKGYQTGNPTQFPDKTPKKLRPTKQTRLLIIYNQQHQILLMKRPDRGIWGGLWSLPECDVQDDYKTWSSLSLSEINQLPVITHQFTHFILEIFPICLSLSNDFTLDSREWIWYTLTSTLPGGVAAPVSQILNQLRKYQ